MKIRDVRAVAVNLKPVPKTKPRVDPDPNGGYFVSPMARYEQELPGRAWTAKWPTTACVVTAEDGTWGLGLAPMAGPVCSVINDHFAELLVSQDPMATEKLWDIMRRSSAAYGTAGLASYAISAVDNAMWDLKGKLLGRPVYELLGGPVKDRIFSYASNTLLTYSTKDNMDWFLELGFKAVKLFLRHGPEDGVAGIGRSEELVAQTREQIGPDVELMVDAWMSPNIEHAVRLAEALRPYRIKWLEEYLLPEDIDSHFRVRERIPWQILATGEHWYGVHPFALAATHGLVDIFQPDVQWGGGVTAGVKICHLAEAHGLTVMPHASANYPFGQHLVAAMPAAIWGERSEGVSPPGVPLAEMVVLPGTPVIEDGYVVPSEAPGFGFEFDLDWLEARTV